MDDEIIYSWCFHDVECFDSTPSAAIIILDKDLESFSSLRIPARSSSSGSHPAHAFSPRHLQKIIVWEHNPTRKIEVEITSLNRGRFNANALPPLIPNQGPLTRGPSICPPHPPRGTPHERPRGPAWTRVASCHVSAPCAPLAPRVAHSRPCHVAS